MKAIEIAVRFSYTDAVSFAVMHGLGVTDAFAFEKHFSEAGFTRVLHG